MKKIAILQSNYIPWKGYFDIINSVDEFVLYDDVQYTKRDWRNRNKIKTANGLLWLTIPVNIKGKYYQKINETTISGNEWRLKHWQSIKNNYSNSSYFKNYKEIFERLFLDSDEKNLSKVNYTFITEINKILGINTKISWSTDFIVEGDKTDRLLNVCKELKATEYVSGPSAMSYLKTQLFDAESIKVSWIDYSGYSNYNQLFPPFEHAVSIIDLIFNEGENAKKFMKSF
jgi:WbqC-like protein family